MKRECNDPRIGRLIGAYELDLLPRREVEAFEEHLASCPDCLQELYEHSAAVTTMHQQPGGILKRTIAEAEPVLETPSGVFARLRLGISDLLESASRRSVRWPWAVPVGIVAAVLLVTFLTVIDRGGRSDLAGLAQVEPLAYVPLETRDVGAYEELESGLASYHQGEYEGAILHLELGLDRVGEEPLPDRDLFTLYLGVAYVLSGRAKDSLTPLDEAAASSLAVVADRAQWYLAQALLLTGDAESAIRLLEGLSEESPGYSEKARKQLLEVRQLTGGDE